MRNRSGNLVTPVPLLDLARHHAPLQDEISAAMRRVCESGCFALGPEVAKLEATIADYCGVPYAVGCASGSDALLLALMAIDLGPGDEVILPSFTFFATASAVERLGATPVFADIDPVSFNLDPESVKRHLTVRTRAIIPVHLYGRCVEMDPILHLAERYGLVVVEDCAQAIGAEYHGRRAGAMGDFGCFSFYPTKNLGGAGDGGMITVRDEELAKRLRQLRVHGMEPRYYHAQIGINSRLDGLQAAFLNVKFPHLESWTAKRELNARRYGRLFREAGVDRWVTLPDLADSRDDDHRMVWNQYVIRVPDGRRDELRTFLRDRQIGSEIYYPLGLHRQECFRYLGCENAELPETDRAAQEVLAIPCFPELTEAEQRSVVEAITAFFTQRETSSTVPEPVVLFRRSRREKSASPPRGRG
ncbi:MAG: DegT/DnrJ/EryC1/StrS family aminotransferase [Planctomycetia bacterium]|nr:DegT/DnrJ/EryC1/StrS family aminotransferase [Planctomycetia bacterium]